MATHDVTLHMLVSAAWLDITQLNDNTRVLIGDDAGAQAITITRGRQDEQGKIGPTTVELTYLDRLNVLDGQNYLSPYYGLIGPSTPVRVTVDGNVRAEIELASLRSTTIPTSETTPIIQHQFSAAGQRLRIEGAKKPMQSAATRRYRAERPWQWWAMEKGPGVQITNLASSIPTRRPDVPEARTDLVVLRASPASVGALENARTSGVVSGDTTTGPPGAAGAVNMSGGGQLQATFPVPGLGAGLDVLIVEGAFQFASPVESGNVGQIVRLNLTAEVTIGVFAQPEVDAGPLVFEINSGTEIISLSNSQVVPDDGSWHHLIMILERASATTFDYVTYYDGEPYFAGTTTATALADITQFTLSPSGELGAVSQWAIWKDDYEPDGQIEGWSRISGYSGLWPDGVIDALLTEQGIETNNNSPSALFSETIQITALPAGALFDQVDVAADCGQHLVIEKRDEYDEITRILRDSRYNRLPTVTITYQQLVGDLVPVTDSYDGRIVNDFTASNGDGAEERYVIPDDDPLHWTTQAPPTGAGVRDQSGQFPVTAGNLRQLAAWITHARGWKEKRWLGISVNLSKTVEEFPDTGFTAEQIAGLRELDAGHVLAIDCTDSPATVPYNELRLSIEGYVETAAKFGNEITFNATPADIWEVDVTEFGSTARLANVIDDNDTSVRVAPGDGPFVSDTEEDFYISIGGDPMKVTAQSTSTPAQVGTPGAAVYADNAAVVPALATGATVDVGHLMLCWATSRANTCTFATPSGWTLITTSAAGYLFGKFYRTGDTAPTLTPSGGSAGVTIGAQVAACAFLSMTPDKDALDPLSLLGVNAQANTSAQNVAFPYLGGRRPSSAQFVFARKDDDWTSVATPAGFAPVATSSSTTGNDMGMAWYFKAGAGVVPATAAGSAVVTGGASATSAGMTVGLRPIHILTVQRAIAGAGASHVTGDAIHIWRPGAVAL